MKKIYMLLSLAAIVLVSCSVEEVQSTLSDGSLVLTGNASVTTKVSIGEKDGEVYPLMWTEGDCISINSKDASVAGALSGELASIVASTAGKTSGDFQTVNRVVPESDMDIVILYPGNKMEYEDYVVTGTVEDVQTQVSANSSAHIGSSCVAFAETSVKTGQTGEVSFTLNHKTAFVKVIVGASETYSDYKLVGVTLNAPNDDYVLSGSLSYNITTEESHISKTSPSVGVTISSPSRLTDDQTVYFTALPCDLTDQEVSVIVTLEDANGGQLSVPIVVDGGLLKEDYLSIINLDFESGVPAWYEPVDSREFLGRWAYGPQNTFFIKQSLSSVNSITIDVKARGDFSKVTEPKYCGLPLGSANTSGGAVCYLVDEDGNTVSSNQETPTVKVNDDYTITVYCYAQYNGGHSYDGWTMVAIYDEDYNIIWSFMICKYNEDDEPSDVKYPNFTLLDRNLGVPYGNKEAAEKGTFLQENYATAYFQWGRKDPFPYAQMGLNDAVQSDSSTGIEASISHPYTLYCVTGENDNWIQTGEAEQTLKLWGGESKSSRSGEETTHYDKTIYDPCPEGYRVPNSTVINEVLANGEYWEVTTESNGNNLSSRGTTNTSSPFYTNGTSVLAYKLSDGTYDYWPYCGANYATSGWGGNRSADTKSTALTYWSSNPMTGSNEPKQAFCSYYVYRGGWNEQNDEATHRLKQYALGVRCMKDE